MQKMSQRIGLVCGGLCLLVALALVLIGNLSSRYILEQQVQDQGQALASQLAREIAPVIASGDLIRLEVTLESLLQRYQLRLLAVSDLDRRPLGSSGSNNPENSKRFEAAIYIGDNLAGQLSLLAEPAAALLEQRRMAMGMLFLAILLSLFVAVVAAKWGQRLSQRLLQLQEQLSATMPDRSGSDTLDELTGLEQVVAQLPLELLQAPDTSSQRSGDYLEAGLLYVHLDSLGRYVDTLDEQSLLAYTDRQQQLAEAAAGLYGGSLSVVRQFGLLLSFSEPHSSGSPGFRAASTAWLLQKLAAAVDSKGSLKHDLSMACGLGECARGNAADIYPALYNQHIIDTLSQLASQGTSGIVLSENCAVEADIANRCQLTRRNPELQVLVDFEEPYCDLLERQRQLLLRELAIEV